MHSKNITWTLVLPSMPWDWELGGMGVQSVAENSEGLTPTSVCRIPPNLERKSQVLKVGTRNRG